jgi:hypothetical protein
MDKPYAKAHQTIRSMFGDSTRPKLSTFWRAKIINYSNWVIAIKMMMRNDPPDIGVLYLG